PPTATRTATPTATSVGTGPAALAATPTSPGAAPAVPPGAALAPTATAAPAPMCAPRPAAHVTTARSARGHLQTARSATGANNLLRSWAFGAATNAIVETSSQSGSGGFAVALPPGTTSTTFTLSRTLPGQPATVLLTVTDSCGDWPTLVGGGPTAF